jgi:D-alanyl-D-alanine carboxypeptidase
VPNYFGEKAFMTRVREEPRRAWHPVELVDHAAAHGTPSFPPGEGFAYSDTGYVITGILLEQITGRPLHKVYRDLVFDPLGMDTTWLEGHEPARKPEAAHHYTEELDWTTLAPTIDWAGGGLVTTAPDLARFIRGLWSARIVDSRVLDELTRWTPGASFPAGHTLRYERYGLGIREQHRGGSRAAGAHRLHRDLRLPRARPRRGSDRHPQRLTCRPLAARSCPLPGVARGGLI